MMDLHDMRVIEFIGSPSPRRGYQPPASTPEQIAERQRLAEIKRARKAARQAKGMR